MDPKCLKNRLFKMSWKNRNVRSRLDFLAHLDPPTGFLCWRNSPSCVCGRVFSASAPKLWNALPLTITVTDFLSYALQTLDDTSFSEWCFSSVLDLGWRGGSVGRAWTRDRKTRGSHPVRGTRKICESFSESKCCADSLSVCPTPRVYIYARIRRITYAC